MSLRESPAARGLGQLAQRAVERLALAVERVGRLVDGGTQRPLHLPGRRAQLDGQLRQCLFHLVPLHRNGGAV